MSYVDSAAAVLGPTDTRKQLISGTGAVEAVNEVALPLRIFTTILVGNVAVRIALKPTAGLVTVVDSTNIVLPANGRLDYVCDEDSRFVYAEADDGASAFQLWVWPSSIKS